MNQPEPSNPPSAATVSANRLSAVLRNRNLVLYLASRLIASLGQQMLTVAVGWEIYERTHSALALGLVGLTQMMPMILGTLPAGHVADHYNRRVIILIATLATAGASVGLAVISSLQLPIGWMYLCLFAAGTARTFLWPASASFLPSLVARASFSKAVTLSTGCFHLSSVIGPAAGGALIAAFRSAHVVYLLNAGALIVCFCLVWMVRSGNGGVVQGGRMTVSSLIAGFRFVFASRIIFGTITLDMMAVLLGGATALLPVYAKDILQVGPAGLGLLQAALPLGALLTAAVIAYRPPMERAGRALLWSVAGFGAATIVFGLSRNYWLSFAMLFVCGALDNISVVIRHTLVQVLTPDEKRGRVSAVNSLFIGTSNELGGFESGMVAHWFGPVISVVSGGIGTLVVVVATAWIWPEIRKYGRLDAEQE